MLVAIEGRRPARRTREVAGGRDEPPNAASGGRGPARALCSDPSVRPWAPSAVDTTPPRGIISALNVLRFFLSYSLSALQPLPSVLLLPCSRIVLYRTPTTAKVATPSTTWTSRAPTRSVASYFCWPVARRPRHPANSISAMFLSVFCSSLLSHSPFSLSHFMP